MSRSKRLFGSLARDTAAVAGLVLVVVGLRAIYPPLAWIFAGGVLVAGAVVLSLIDHRRRP